MIVRHRNQRGSSGNQFDALARSARAQELGSTRRSSSHDATQLVTDLLAFLRNIRRTREQETDPQSCMIPDELRNRILRLVRERSRGVVVLNPTPRRVNPGTVRRPQRLVLQINARHMGNRDRSRENSREGRSQVERDRADEQLARSLDDMRLDN